MNVFSLFHATLPLVPFNANVGVYFAIVCATQPLLAANVLFVTAAALAFTYQFPAAFGAPPALAAKPVACVVPVFVEQLLSV